VAVLPCLPDALDERALPLLRRVAALRDAGVGVGAGGALAQRAGSGGV